MSARLLVCVSLGRSSKPCILWFLLYGYYYMRSRTSITITRVI
nr:MAG TPA: hypothetical protein [Caudoviricetes sp.]